ncbi:hypothetical protein EX30DRAFT_150619 [Ascodesmis nigricans]|uniref:Extracellular membrane protein CFEM domain-containing protein n=1 Tax=Ascodesmis nigricans TaxID=341454 RepID=A0A4S2N2R9_9PEZI|nr:hypothetical protein EX30DRAFT_150619 [Ascodesmis nigricans]
MFKHALFFAFFALFAVFASATEAPPACVLACVNEETKHSDFKAVCNSKNMHPCLKAKCASADLEDAVSHFQTTCKAQGQTALLVEDEDEDSKGSSKGNSTVLATLAAPTRAQADLAPPTTTLIPTKTMLTPARPFTPSAPLVSLALLLPGFCALLFRGRWFWRCLYIRIWPSGLYCT